MRQQRYGSEGRWVEIEEKKVEERSGFRFLYTYVKKGGTLRQVTRARYIAILVYIIHDTRTHTYIHTYTHAYTVISRDFK